MSTQPTVRRKQSNASKAETLDGESYASRVDQHDAEFDAVKGRLDALETVSNGDRLLEAIQRDSRIKEKLEGWIWGVITGKARKVFFFVLFTILALSFVNFAMERFWTKTWDFFVSPVVTSPRK
ncbi:MAG: hypothetical protein COV91_05595 [Candidatus Taylorbacteria bacterium CG11_big_fil_rev_8_21_14_0_20_46_11]|uniref:Uncharacterized protein n=1 Tax=Candidatus Taylorbacteria bacterium CG11_big_fil_rev_8_21_14_0_20_46_11 TaxID=1975025 RepID=A0A2H0KA85_9BACT|nr:MAG: hypothetical protein COV91_05595 [Candidatus Taylorbacteria bacterium CG11_big_fil_rev_8_21_14_0_20_46_11]